MGKIYIESNQVKKIYIGNTPVEKVYLGNQKVYTLSRLPEGYKELQYVETDGHQRIGLDYVGRAFNSSDEITISYMPLDNAGAKYAFGITEGYGGPQFYIKVSGTKYGYGYYNLDNVYGNDIAIDYLFHRHVKKGYQNFFDGVQIKSNSNTKQFTTNNKLYLGCINNVNGYSDDPRNYAIGRYDYFLWKDSSGNKIAELIPCTTDDDSEVGFYDLVNNVFKQSEGESVFIAGPEI